MICERTVNENITLSYNIVTIQNIIVEFIGNSFNKTTLKLIHCQCHNITDTAYNIQLSTNKEYTETIITNVSTAAYNNQQSAH